MNWTKKLWRTLPIALVIVLATAAVTFAQAPTGVKITGTPTTDYPNPHKRDANVKVNFEYISDPDKVEHSTTVEAWLLDHATKAEVAWARKEIEDGEYPNGFINVTVPTDAPHGQLYDVKVIVRNSDGDSEAVIEKGGADEKGAVIVDAEPPAKIGWVKMYEAGTPDKEVHSPINFNTPKFKWAATTDEGSKVEKYFWEVTNKVTAFAGNPTQEGEVGPVAGATEYECGPVDEDELDDGTYYFHVRAIDSVGNKSVPQTLKFVVDTTAPALTMEKPAEVGGTRWAMIKPTLEIKAVEAGSGLDEASTVFKVVKGTDEIKGSGSWTELVWTWTPNADLTDGTEYTVNMKVKDNAGNETTLNETFKVDAKAPEISGLLPEPDKWTNKGLEGAEGVTDPLTISATFADSQDGSGIDEGSIQILMEHFVPHSDFATETNADGSVTVTYTPTELTPRKNISVTVLGKDNAGNAVSKQWWFHYDPDAPVLSKESPKTWTNTTTPVVSVKVEETLSGLDPAEGACTFEVKKDGTAVEGTLGWNGDVWEWRPKNELEKCEEYAVAVKVTDNAENAANTTWSFQIDTEAPEITNLTPADKTWVTNAKPQIGAELTDKGCPAGIDANTIKMTLDGVTVSKKTSTNGGWEYSSDVLVYNPAEKLAEGLHTVTVDVMDNAGNAAKTAVWTFEVDTILPVFKCEEAKPKDWINNPNTVVTIPFVEEGSGLDEENLVFIVKDKLGNEIDGEVEVDHENGIITWIPKELLEAPMTYNVRVVGSDIAGNEAAKACEWKFTVDVAKPVIFDPQPTPDYKFTQTPEEEELVVSAKYRDEISGIDIATAKMTINGEEVEAAATLEDIKYTLEEPEDGRYIITVNVSDRAGNAADELKWEFYIDTTPPTDPGKPYAGNLGKDGKYYINTRRPVFYWAASVDQEPGSGLDEYIFQFGPKDEMPEPEEDVWNGALIGGEPETNNGPIGKRVKPSQGASIEQYMHDVDVVLNVGAEYAARVKAYDRAGHGSKWVNDTTIIYDPDKPTDVTGLKVEKTVERYPTFTWNAAEDVISGVAGYTVRIKPAGSETWDVHFIEDPGTEVVTWKSVKQLDPGDYQISVTAEDVAGNKGLAATLDFTVEPIEPSVYGVYPVENKAYKVNEISTITFKVGGDFDGNVKVYVGDTQLADWRVVNVSKTVGEHKYYILLDGAVMTPGTTMTIKIDVGGMNTHDYVYEVDAERSGFGFGRLRPW